MSNDFPPNVVLYLRREIERRTRYKIELERTPMPLTHNDFKLQKKREIRQNLESSIKNLTRDIILITKRHFPAIEVDPSNDEVTISNILEVLPPPEMVVIRKVLEGME